MDVLGGRPKEDVDAGRSRVSWEKLGSGELGAGRLYCISEMYTNASQASSD